MVNKTALDLDLQDVFNIHKRDIFLSMNCHAIGKITKFKSSDQTAEIQINYSKKFSEADPSKQGLTRTVIKEYPVLVDCPVVVITGGDAGLTMPIKEGDDCLVCFNDRDIDKWFEGATNGPVESNRLHAMSDGIALVGLRSLSKSLAQYDSDNPVLFNKATKITVKENKIKMENAVESLNDILQDLITEIKGLITTPAVLGAPSTISPASQALLDLVAARLGELIE